MNRIVSYLGPRGWAVLTLAGGAALASPFLRPAQHDVSGLYVTAKAPRLAGSGPFPTRASSAVGGSGSGAPGLSGRVVSGVLPSTLSRPADWGDDANTPALPDWVRQSSPLDELIARGAATDVPAAAVESTAGELRQLRAWRGAGLPQAVEQSAAAIDRQVALHRDSPWDTSLSSEPSRPGAEQAIATTWPDQSLGFDWEQLESDRLAPREYQPTQRTVATPLHRPQAGASYPTEASGAKLSRSGDVASLPAQPNPVESPTGQPVDRSRFVYQPGLKPLSGGSP